ncbi:MAG: SsrA-binding protein SmpB [Spirochaetaceae bacterium]|nr:SsrA-binding protein SmpB [Spirochaetaceae bacterium]
MSGQKVLAKNKKAYFDYFVEDEIECGICLQGTEVKSMREGRFSFPDSFAEIVNGEVWVRNLLISEYLYGSYFNHEPARLKKLLLHKDEIKRLKRKVDEKGVTLVPLVFYLKGNKVKVTLGLCKGKKLYDKRAVIRERDVARETQREMRH